MTASRINEKEIYELKNSPTRAVASPGRGLGERVSVSPWRRHCTRVKFWVIQLYTSMTRSCHEIMSSANKSPTLTNQPVIFHDYNRRWCLRALCTYACHCTFQVYLHPNRCMVICILWPYSFYASCIYRSKGQFSL